MVKYKFASKEIWEEIQEKVKRPINVTLSGDELILEFDVTLSASEESKLISLLRDAPIRGKTWKFTGKE